jgi:Ribonuclease G/E
LESIMSQRRLYLDEGYGESRGVVTLEGRPERLLIVREDEAKVQALGAVVAARVRALDRPAGLAFLDLGQGPDAALNLSKEIGPLAEGQFIEVEIRAEGRKGKGPTAKWLGPAEGPVRLLRPAPDLAARLKHYASDAEIITGGVARTMADAAQDEALETVFSLPGGGSISVEPTRALTAIDVDLGARKAATPKQAARGANFAALAVAARVLRLKGLGGLVVIDLVGSSHDAPALISAARAAFGPDNPGVAMGAISRFGLLELSVPRRTRPCLDLLTDETGAPTPLTLALKLLRNLEREALADGGGRFVGLAREDVIVAARPSLSALTERLGARITLQAQAPGAAAELEVARL